MSGAEQSIAWEQDRRTTATLPQMMTTTRSEAAHQSFGAEGPSNLRVFSGRRSFVAEGVSVVHLLLSRGGNLQSCPVQFVDPFLWHPQLGTLQFEQIN